jgi:GNAT superfamily N-acetyltransferase
MLPRYEIVAGCGRDFGRLARFHYRGRPPATFARVWCAWAHHAPYLRLGPTLAGVVVVSYPTLACHARERVLGLGGLPARQRQRWVNENLRAISRIVIHPSHRGAGLATRLIAQALRNSETRYTECVAMLGRHCPALEKAGMKADWPEEAEAPVYYLFDREAVKARCT